MGAFKKIYINIGQYWDHSKRVIQYYHAFSVCVILLNGDRVIDVHWLELGWLVDLFTFFFQNHMIENIKTQYYN